MALSISLFKSNVRSLTNEIDYLSKQLSKSMSLYAVALQCYVRASERKNNIYTCIYV